MRPAPLPAVLALLALALAGCIATPPAAEPLAPAAAQARSLAAFTQVVDYDGGTGEPSMGVTPNGSFFTNGGQGQAEPVFGSTDGGRSWRFLADPMRRTGNSDPDLAVSADGTIWESALYFRRNDPVGVTGCAAVATSRDGGQTWPVYSEEACFPPTYDRQYLVPTAPGTAIIYAHQGACALVACIPGWQAVAKSTDYGATWLPVSPGEGVQTDVPFGGSDWGGGGFWDAKTGSIYLTFTWFGNTGWNPAALVSRDGGASFTLVKLPNNGGQPVGGLALVDGAADAAGNAYLTWAEESASHDVAVYLAASRDDGATWSKAVRVDAGNASKVFPMVTAGAAGRVAVAYDEASEPGDPAKVTRTATWNVTLAWTADALAADATWEHGALSTGIARRGGICADGSGCDKDRQLLDYFALKTTPDGRVAAVWPSTEDVAGKRVDVFGITREPLLGSWAFPAAATGAARGLLPLAVP